MVPGRDRTRDPWICSQTVRHASVARHVTDCAMRPGNNLVKCVTRQWLELTISAYISRIAYLPHCTRLCYPERNDSSFLNRMCRIYFSLKKDFSLPNNKIIFKPSPPPPQKKIKTYRNLVAMAVRVLIPIPFDFLVLCRRSAPLVSSIYRVCTLPPVLCTHVGFKKGILAV